MTTPITQPPSTVVCWIARLRWLRWMDVAVAWFAVLPILRVALPAASALPAMIVATTMLFSLSRILRLRVRWRPVSGLTTMLVSRGLNPGDQAWFVHGRTADLILVTARHGFRVVVAKPDQEGTEGMRVRRTRVLLLPAAS